MYGIKTDTATGSDADDDDEEEEDIENAIRKELGELKDKSQGGRGEPGPGSGGRSVFTEVRVSQECLLFMRCRQPPVEPVAFCRRICVDAATVGHGGQRARYLNRLTPVSVMVKASETGVEEGARRALAGHFRLKTKGEAAGVGVGAEGQSKEGEEEVVVSEEKETPATVSSDCSSFSQDTLSLGSWLTSLSTVCHPTFDTEPQHAQKRRCHQTRRQPGGSSTQGQPGSPRQGHSDRHIPGMPRQPQPLPLPPHPYLTTFFFSLASQSVSQSVNLSAKLTGCPPAARTHRVFVVSASSPATGTRSSGTT